MKLLKFPPICAKWCSTFKHLKRLYLTPLEITRICHKCITWKEGHRHPPKPPATQPKLPIDQ